MNSCTYDRLMRDARGHIILKLDTKEPIELLDFVSGFSAIANQYERFIKESYPDMDGESRVYVREVRAGCIEADLIPLALATLIDQMDKAIIVEEFVRRYASRLSAYFNGGRAPDVTRSDLKDFMGGIAPIANDPDAKATLQAAVFEDGDRKVKVALQFSTPEARTAQKEIEAHRVALEAVSRADHERKLMYFTRSDVGDATIGKPSGERVRIDELHPKPLALTYASELAEEKIKHYIREADENVYKKGFVVDVNVQTKNGRPTAYSVKHVHDVIDLPDGDED